MIILRNKLYSKTKKKKEEEVLESGETKKQRRDRKIAEIGTTAGFGLAGGALTLPFINKLPSKVTKDYLESEFNVKKDLLKNYIENLEHDYRYRDYLRSIPNYEKQKQEILKRVEKESKNVKEKIRKLHLHLPLKKAALVGSGVLAGGLLGEAIAHNVSKKQKKVNIEKNFSKKDYESSTKVKETKAQKELRDAQRKRDIAAASIAGAAAIPIGTFVGTGKPTITEMGEHYGRDYEIMNLYQEQLNNPYFRKFKNITSKERKKIIEILKKNKKNLAAIDAALLAGGLTFGAIKGLSAMSSKDRARRQKNLRENKKKLEKQ